MSNPNWRNRTLWTGDNLDIMRGMNSESVDLIYLDPPFNSNKTYSAPIGSKAAGALFKDAWTLDDVDLAWHGEIAEQNSAVYAVIDTAGVAHGSGMKSYLIMMAVRLLELHRVLKPTGSLYLHCDPTASHYLKLLMDAVFGRAQFRNEVIWQRYGSHNDASKYGRVTDSLLFYADKGATWASIRLPLSDADVARRYTNKDDRGRYTTSPLHARTLSGGGYDYTWKGIADTWKFPKERLNELESHGRIHWPKQGKIPRRKVYLSENPGKPLSNLWTDIGIAAGKERTGYPTQKPLALLDRIIKASSNEGDVVLDPFAGCATACVAAEGLHREWIGIDLSPLAAKLVKSRLRDYMGLYYDVHHRDGHTETDGSRQATELPHAPAHCFTASRKAPVRAAGCCSRFVT